MALDIAQLFCRNDLLLASATFASAIRASATFTVSRFATFAVASTITIFHNFLFIKRLEDKDKK